MRSRKIGNRDFTIITGEINNHSYSATIKKLSMLPRNGFAQIVPLRLVAGEMHLSVALEHALSAFETKTSFTKKPELEFLVHLTGQKQLGRAIKKSEFAREPLALVIQISDGKTIEKTKKDLGFEEKKFAIHETGKNTKKLAKEFGYNKPALFVQNHLKSA